MSPILTQAATARSFDIQDEIEFTDDLDKKPDDEKLSEKDFPFLLAELLNDIRLAVENEQIVFPLPKEFSVAGDFEIAASGISDGGGAVGANVSDKTLERILRDAIDKKFYPKAAQVADFDRDKSKTVRINLAADADDLFLKISFGKTTPEKFAEFLNRQFSASAISTTNETAKQIYRNTSAVSENNQVFIVTRLPRGSLDNLLKQDAKAEK